MVPSDRRHWVVRIVAVAVGRLVAGRLGAERPADGHVARHARAVQVIGREDGARQRPFVLVTPDVGAHHVDADRRLARLIVALAVEPPLEPAQLFSNKIDPRVAAELYLADLCHTRASVRPGTDDDPLVGAGDSLDLAPVCMPVKSRKAAPA